MAGNSNPTYPEEYFQILLSLPEDGEPIVAEYPSAGEAEEERLRFYNFLKWCRRPKNLMAASHLQGRYNMVRLSRKEHELHFSLAGVLRFEKSSNVLRNAITAKGLPLPHVPATANPNAYRAMPKGEAAPIMQMDVAPAQSGFGLPFAAGADLDNEIFRRLEAAQAQPEVAKPEPKRDAPKEWFGEETK